MNALGTHLLLELKDCDAASLNDVEYVRKSLMHAAESVGATIVGETFHEFSPYGVTGVVAIAESHLSIHTWPEHGYAAVDVFTCGESFKPKDAAEILVGRFSSQTFSIMEVKRGVLSGQNPSQYVSAVSANAG